MFDGAESFNYPLGSWVTDLVTDMSYMFRNATSFNQYINYLIHHESVVMKGLNELSPYCPHFCKSFGSFICQTDPRSGKKGNIQFHERT
jgi:hypothetical protein